ncbi:P4HB, partial [Symbiodinium sp. KB8]
MKSVIFAALLGLAAVWAVEIEEEDDVLVLTNDNFDEAIKQHDPLLVEFYAPWCGHCKRLAPAYAAAAATLKNDGLRIAKVDATAEEKLARTYGIQGFPTLKFFKGGNPSDYSGGRSEQEIVNWVRKKSGPAYKTIDSVDTLNSNIDDAEVLVVGFFASESEAGDFITLANKMEDLPFALVTDSAIASE